MEKPNNGNTNTLKTMTVRTKPICFDCKHFDIETCKCPAFKGDIPDEILFGNNNHRKPLPEQKNKIVYEKIVKT
jgi:hypothetical protein